MTCCGWSAARSSHYDFMQGIHGLLDKMLADLRQIPTVAAAPIIIR